MTIHNTLLDGISLDSGDFRRIMHAALGGAPGSFAGGIGATDGAAHGACGYTQLRVTESNTPAMSVKVSAGLASIRGSASATLGPFPFYSDADETLTISAAHPTNGRKDLVIAQIHTNGDTPELRVVTGTPSGSPADPSLVAFPDALVLARVNVAAAASSIVNANVDDLRTWAGRWASSWGRVAGATSSTQQTTITTITDITAMSITFNAVAGRRYEITGEVSVQQVTNAGSVTITLADGSNNALKNNTQGLSATFAGTIPISYDYEAAASGSVTFKLRAASSAASLTLRPTGSSFHRLLVKDVGPV